MKDRSAMTRWQRRVAVYRCCLYKAEFDVPDEYKYLKFQGSDKVNTIVKNSVGREIKPNLNKGIPIEDAVIWFTAVWENYNNEFFEEYKIDHKEGKDWASEGLKSLLQFLTRKTHPKTSKTDNEKYKKPDHYGYKILSQIKEFHTATIGKPFQEEIIQSLRDGKVVLVDLSQGNPVIQAHYSENYVKKYLKMLSITSIKNETNNNKSNFTLK